LLLNLSVYTNSFYLIQRSNLFEQNAFINQKKNAILHPVLKKIQPHFNNPSPEWH